ncbi:MAG: histidine kinase [Solirubrobacterales bacterium]|nr:histidine kinase [Solirubrobacterales bacterium]
MAALDRLGAVGAQPEAALDGLVRLAARVCSAASAEINLVGAEQLWFRAAQGLGTPGVAVPRELTFCTWTVLDPDRPLLVDDALEDERFKANPFVADGTIRSYAGFPLISEGHAIGTMCVHDPAPKTLSPDQLDALSVLATAAQTQVGLRRHVEALSAMARTDALTGAANRRAIDEALDRELSRSARSGTPMALVMLDMDRFKSFNDEFGHPAGDLLLQRTAAAWKRELRAGDLLGRWGGEEFCVLLADCRPEAAAAVAERVRAAVPDGRSCSAGVASWNGHESIAELVLRTDRALYEAKHAGRDRTVLAPLSAGAA